METWFRRRGLPMVVKRRVRGAAVLPRAMPAQVFLLLSNVLLTWVTDRVAKLNVNTENTPYVLGLLALSLAALVVPIVVSWLIARIMRSWTERTRMAVAVAVVVISVVVVPVVQKAAGQISNLVEWIAIDAGIVVGLLFVVVVGAGSILGWALRVAIRQISAVATRALPLLMLFLLFGFFATETWQISDKLESGGHRTSLWLVIAFFVVFGAMFLVSILRDEGRAVLVKHRASGTRDYVALLWQTPLDGLVPDDDHAVRNYPLTRPEKLNLALVVFLAQALQAVVFSVVVFWFFVVFGLISVDPSVMETWLGHPPKPSGTLFTLRLPGISDELIRVSLFLAGFSGMYFAAAIATDSTYRTSFFDPLMSDVARSLAARDVYLTLWDEASMPTSYPEVGPLVVRGDLEWEPIP
ncbi:hypothetical protein [Actinocrispum wychmicini]|uniref:hypothetical protein n=1 Tax=Actinocrispum wychmicini TaxID=1213861 RepID=UPI00104710BC|nr:hypothetical protein [Actinocrispum wychmicini]